MANLQHYVGLIVFALVIISRIVQALAGSAKKAAPRPTGQFPPPARPGAPPSFGAPPPAGQRPAAPPGYGQPQQYGAPPVQQQPPVYGARPPQPGYPIVPAPPQYGYPQQPVPSPVRAPQARPAAAPQPTIDMPVSRLEESEPATVSQPTAGQQTFNDVLRSQPPLVAAIIMQEILSPPRSRRHR